MNELSGEEGERDCRYNMCGTATFICVANKLISILLLSFLYFSSSPYLITIIDHSGWGIGGQRELTPEEFAKQGDRSYFEGYQTKQQGDFMSQIRQEKEDLKKSELEELLGVARIAGIEVKDPSKRLNKFDSGDIQDEDDDNLDLSV